jgi:hypothetical protein
MQQALSVSVQNCTAVHKLKQEQLAPYSTHGVNVALLYWLRYLSFALANCCCKCMNLSISVADADGIEVNECQRSNAAVESKLRTQRERQVRVQICVLMLAKK